MSKKEKKKSHTFLKVFLGIIIGIILLNILFFIGLYIRNVRLLKAEAKYLTPPGTYVEVDGRRIHTIVGGDAESDNVLVFLHSDNIIDDSIALQPLWNELKNCRYVYFDRSGYGFSESSGAPKDIESIITEARAVLKELNIEGPYTLVPFGTAGIQALYWADTYPEEIKNIIGISMNYPEQFTEYTTDDYCGTFNSLLLKFTKIGGHRIFKNKMFPTDKYGIFTDEQMNIRNALAGKYAYTEDMYEEQRNTVNNAKKTAELGFPENVDIYLIYNNLFLEPYLSTDDEVKELYTEGMEENVDYAEVFNSAFRDYYGNYKNVTIDEIEGPGRLYIYNPTKLAELINIYLE
ncbi:MAG: alpha/beta hydrolase [Lachnospiraceae bacterium]|nr:alpha/beta hydrolase [Lachnospiraceae bacterium]MBQ9607878.1 alpha/beta hydrolase [Lachnospiraceae bacterium]